MTARRFVANMRYRAFLQAIAVIVVLLITWGISNNSSEIHKKARNILGMNNADLIKTTFKITTPAPVPKCDLSTICPPDHFALRIRSGAANVIGPQICFEDKIVMGHVLNNVGPGLNIVIINGEKGVVEKFGYLNMKAGKPEDILEYLKAIETSMIVMVASYDDVTTKMTDEMREIFVGMGSTLIKSVKHRDNWVFVGRAGMENNSSFEKQAVNDEKTNIYEGWPAMVEVGGCFPRGTNRQKP